MKIYVGHSSAIDYKNEIYRPIRESVINSEHEFILPHETSDNPGNTYELLASCDLFIAEISDKSIGLGIELGWADRAGVPIFCLSKAGARYSPSIQTVCDRFGTYEDARSLIEQIRHAIDSQK
jgi:hypothetical protein